MPSKTISGVKYTIPDALFDQLEEARGEDGNGTILVATLKKFDALCNTAEYNKRVLAIYLILWLGMEPKVFGKFVSIRSTDQHFVSSLVEDVVRSSTAYYSPSYVTN